MVYPVPMIDWPRKLSSIPEGLTATEVARRLGLNYQAVRSAIRKHKYPTQDGRKTAQRANRRFLVELVDWTMPPVKIAAKYGVSKQRVCFVAKQLGIRIKDSRGRPRKRKLGNGYCQSRD